MPAPSAGTADTTSASTDGKTADQMLCEGRPVQIVTDALREALG